MNLDKKAWEAPHLQKVYRSLMSAFSYPGEIYPIAPLDNFSVLEQILICLLDGQVTLYQQEKLFDEQFLNLLRSTLVNDVSQGDFLLFSGDSYIADLEPNVGTLESPEHGATLILKVDELSAENGMMLCMTGPGIKSEISTGVIGLDPNWLLARNEWCSHFPLGIDMIFVAQESLIAIPRSTKIKI